MIVQDLRYALRALGRAPAFTAIAVATLALGIGANTAIFSAVRAVLLRPLPYPEPQELVQALVIFRSDTGTAYSPSDFVDMRKENASLSGLAAVNARSYALTDAGDPEQVQAAAVTGDFFPVLGVPALRGRALLPGDDAPGATRVVTISHALWTRRFGGDAAVVGRSIRLDGQSYDVVGIMPPGFSFPAGAELWTPMGFTAADLATQRGAHYLDVIGRLRPAVPVERAQVEAIAQLLGDLATRPLDLALPHLVGQRLAGPDEHGRIVIPDTAKEKPQGGRVIAVGAGRIGDDGTRIPMEVKQGDRILFARYSGAEVTLDGSEYLVMKEEDVLGILV